MYTYGWLYDYGLMIDVACYAYYWNELTVSCFLDGYITINSGSFDAALQRWEKRRRKIGHLSTQKLEHQEI